MRKGAKLVAIAGAFALAVAAPALAQDEGQGDAAVHERHHGARGHDPGKRIEHLREALDLTDEQVAQVRAIFSESEERRRALRESGDREGMRALHEEIHGRMAAVLDETQREKFESLKREHRERHRDRDDRDHAGHEGET